MNPLALGGVVQAIGQIADDLITTDKERLDAEIELKRLGLESSRIEANLVHGQLEVNQAEATSSSVFVAGWRPGVGWVCVAALACQYIARPLVQWGGIVSGHPLPDLPGIDDNLWQLTLGLLGLGGLRTYEKVQGVAK